MYLGLVVGVVIGLSILFYCTCICERHEHVYRELAEHFTEEHMTIGA